MPLLNFYFFLPVIAVELKEKITRWKADKERERSKQEQQGGNKDKKES